MSRGVDAGAETTSLWLELVRVAALAAAFAAQLYLGSRMERAPRLDYCFTRPLCLDQLVSKLSRGGDYNPPALHLALWTISKFTTCSDEALLRWFSCTVGFCGFVATYFFLRKRFAWPVSWVAVMGMWSSSPLLIQQMFEGRFYSFWFASAAVFCLLLVVRAPELWQVLCVAAVAALMCSIHYFGIISLALIAACQLFCNFRNARQRRLTAVALAAGLMSLLACLPFYFGQRAALAVPTWISPPSLGASAAFLDFFGLTYATTVPILAYCFQELLGLGPGDGSSSDGLQFNLYGGACGLILLPAAIVVFSYVVQPAEITRYALPAALAYAPLIALIASKLKLAVLAGIAAAFFCCGLRGPHEVYRGPADHALPTCHAWEPWLRDAIRLANSAGANQPLVLHSRHIAYPLTRYTGVDPEAVRISFLFRGDHLSRFDALEQSVARRMSEMFKLPRTLEPDELRSLDQFYLLVRPGEEERYKGWTAEPLPLAVEPLRAFKMRRLP
jgi:hypothetical protein